MKELKPTMQFTDLCAMLLRELHDVEGKTEEEIKAAMRLMPFVSGIQKKNNAPTEKTPSY